MSFNLVSNINECFVLVRDTVPTSLVYYSHIPVALAALFIGIVVFIKSGRMLASKVLLGITVAFFLWASFDIILWTSYDSRAYMFFWTFMVLFEIFFFILSLYLVYVFIDKKDVPFKIKLIWGFLILPIVFVMGTSYHLTKFSVTDCVPVEGHFYQYYAMPLYGLIFIWILLLVINRYRRANKEFRKQIIYLFLGITFLLLLFLFGETLANYFIDNNILSPTKGYEFEFYGLFGMPIFIAFLSYLIVKYKAFEIKILAVQVLVFALVFLIGSQFFFIKTVTNQILTGITLIIASGFGWMLIRSVKSEVQRKEELQVMSDRLAQANDQLRTLDNAKSEFISIASHQLRTPLTAIKGFISLILEGSYGKISSEINAVLDKVYISNERLIELVDDMLNLSRIESGRMEYNFEKIKLEDVCKEIYDTFAIRARDKGLKLELKIPESPLPEAMTDRNKIREVISNVVDNAVKYTQKGWVGIRLSQKGNSIVVAVADTGIGVPKEEMPYLFEKFSRGKDVSRLNTGGTGLGLHVGKRMMEALHGQIWVESKGAGQGSTFYIEVPTEMEETKEK